MKKKAILSLCTAMLMLSGCGIFKNRTVHVYKLDSLFKSEETSKVNESISHIDTGTIKTIGNVRIITTARETNSSTTETYITPTPGKPFTIGPDGTFHGEAQLVNTKIYKKQSKDKKKEVDEQKQVDEKKGLSNHFKKDSSNTKKQETLLQKRIKDSMAKPNYNWILIVAAILAFVVAVIGLYRKYT
ncbi:hypothetical protein [Mucilaginibacter sp. UYCu711]|uniref:hypothetical protein n=1 Tax=Mucilaginibacter sp. UYCu711 TaxID=3156339 RepID=UPI003D20217C